MPEYQSGVLNFELKAESEVWGVQYSEQLAETTLHLFISILRFFFGLAIFHDISLWPKSKGNNPSAIPLTSTLLKFVI